MQNYIKSFSASKSSQIVNDRLGWDEGSPHRHDCHDPPHGARVRFLDDRPPPRRLAAVARSDPWKVTRAQVGFPGDATRRRRLFWVAGPDRWNTGRGQRLPAEGSSWRRLPFRAGNSIPGCVVRGED
jgi:hypothetical protein